MAQRITSPGYKELMKAYEPYLLIGIANEWGSRNAPGSTMEEGKVAEWRTAHAAAIQHLRSEGIESTLVVTANQWGQGCQVVIDDGAALINDDPMKNVLFDIHMYTYVSYTLPGASNTYAGGEPERIQGCLEDVAAGNLPLVIGEFGNTHSSGPVEWQTIISEANQNGQGHVPWEWYGDTEYPALNLNETWEGPLTSGWGDDIVPLGGAEASIFE